MMSEGEGALALTLSQREREPTGGPPQNLPAARGKVYCRALRVDAEEKI
jgi:hypothetical protein